MSRKDTVRPYRAPTLAYSPAVSEFFGRYPFKIPVEPDIWSVAFLPPFSPGEDWLCLQLKIGAQEGQCLLPRGLLRMILRLAEPQPRAPLNSDIAILLVEMVFNEALMDLETRLGCTLSILRFDSCARPVEFEEAVSGQSPLRVGFRVSFGAQEVFDGLLHLAQETFSALRPHFPALIRTFEAPPVAVSLRVGGMSLSVAEVRALRPGCGIVIGPTARRSVALVAGEALATLAVHDGYRIVIQGGWQDIAQFSLPEWIGHMTDGSAAPPLFSSPEAEQFPETEVPEVQFDTVQVPLSFEIGRRVFTLGELQEIGEGHVIEIGSLSDQKVSVLAHGRRIGEGELVEVGAALAVRLTRINA